MEEEFISMPDLHEIWKNQLNNGDVILDVRSEDEFSEGHIPGSINIPHTQVGHHSEELKKYKKVYIHCRMGGRAQVAFEVLRGFGLENLICVNKEGMNFWKEQGYPME